MSFDLTEFVEYAAALARGQVAGEEPQPAPITPSGSTQPNAPASSSPVTYLDDRRQT